MQSLQIRLPDRVGAAADARRAVDRLAEHLQPDILEDVRFLVNELVTNSIKYGRGKIDLQVAILDGHVRVEVVDDGDGFYPEVEAPASDQTSGRGLFLVQSLADRWGVDGPGPTHVWFEIDCLRRPGARRSPHSRRPGSP